MTRRPYRAFIALPAITAAALHRSLIVARKSRAGQFRDLRESETRPRTIAVFFSINPLISCVRITRVREHNYSSSVPFYGVMIVLLMAPQLRR